LPNKRNYNDAILKSLPADIMKEKSNIYEKTKFIIGMLRKWFEAAIASIGSNEVKSSELKEAEDP
jgi:CRISPR/Cas system CMR-associated protein Cmr1 (group 7 of RAMP superfamily)